jgi:hypothetical protein
MRTKIGTALVLGALVLAPASAGAADPGPSLEQVVVEMANTSAEHAALASYYRSQANQARAEAREHDAMAKTYVPASEQKTTWGTIQERQKMADHCKKLAQQSEAMAQDYEELAKLHEEAAKKAR